MSEIKVSKLTNRAGTGAPNFSQGLKISGTASTLLAPTRTESATEPTSPSNGDTWYDTDNDTYDVYINDEWKRFIGEGGSSSWTVDLSNASYDSVSFSVGTQNTVPNGLALNSDGTKLFMSGRGDDNVTEYHLSTAYDLSTASYDSQFAVTTQENTVQGMTFNTDGTKMFVCGNTVDGATAYDLSTAFDVSTASYNSEQYSQSTQEQLAIDLEFNADGTKLYMAGQTKIYQHSLSTAFDLSTASYDSVYLDCSSENASIQAMRFNPDGTQLLVLGRSNDRVHQYSLSTAYDLSTASSDSVEFDISTQMSNPAGLAFSADGTKMYIVGYTADAIYQYSTGL